MNVIVSVEKLKILNLKNITIVKYYVFNMNITNNLVVCTAGNKKN